MAATEEAKWLDFQKIKDGADVERVLGHYGILQHLERRGDELVGWCPLGEEHGKGDSFAMNVAKRSFQCFACKARGSIPDFVRKHEGSDLRSAAIRVEEIMAEGEALSPARTAAKKTRPYGKKAPSATSGAPVTKRRALPLEMFGWDEALELVRLERLDPENLVVLRSVPRSD